MTGGEKQGAGKMSWHKCDPLLVNPTIVLLSSRTCLVPIIIQWVHFWWLHLFAVDVKQFLSEKSGQALPALSLLSPVMKSHSEWMPLMNESVEH
jgi:hypothetical protein